jgi:hypothetical protein
MCFTGTKDNEEVGKINSTNGVCVYITYRKEYTAWMSA